METKHIENDETEIDLLELAGVVWRKMPLIILITLFFGVLVMLYDKLLVTPMYESTTKICVLAKQNDTLTSGDLQASTMLTKDYVELVKTRDVTEGVIAKLGLMSGDEMMTHEDLLGKMTVTSVSDTRMITISVQDKDPYLACEIANAVREHASVHIQKVLDTQAVNVAEVGNIPTEPVSPDTLRDGLIGGIVGAFLAIAVIVIMFLMDDTINTSEDVERYLGLSTLGVIPLDEKQRKGKKKRQKKVKRRRTGRRR